MMLYFRFTLFKEKTPNVISRAQIITIFTLCITSFQHSAQVFISTPPYLQICTNTFILNSAHPPVTICTYRSLGYQPQLLLPSHVSAQ